MKLLRFFNVSKKVLGNQTSCSFIITTRLLNSKSMVNRVDQGMFANKLWRNIVKSHEDKRLYRGLEFSNKLKVLLVNDAVTEKAAAALDVNVGSMCDPDGLPGLAHFCEHMLFLGTEKYPEENEYSKYLSEHGGSANATTSSDHTQYFFDVLPEHLPGALDRFAQFFLGPLFTESATSREVKAVHSEHEKNLASDSWRINQLEKCISKQGHPYQKFGTGNIETLEEGPLSRGIDVRSELLSFHESWYSANTMTLVVLGRESLDELEALVTPLFLNVVNKNVEPPLWLDHPIGHDQMRLQALVVPIQDLRSLNISFPIPDLHDQYKAAPCHYLAHLVGHEGPGSLLSALKERGWCNSLFSGDLSPAKGFASFNISVDLTVEGLEHVDEITTLLFQYLNMLRAVGPQEWIFDECRQLNTIGFRFKDKESPFRYVAGLASSLHRYPLDDVLVGPYLMTEWQPELIQQVLELLVPSRIRIAVVSNKFETIANLEEPWYGTKYKLDTIDDAQIKKWENCGVCSELKIPERNIFIPTNFDLLPIEETKGSKHPTIIHNSDISRLWFKHDDVFLLPKAVAKFELFSPLAYLDPLNASLTGMFTSLLKDDLNEFSYDASLAGLYWNIGNTKNGLELTVGGYNDKLKVLFDKIVDKLTNFIVNEKRFEILKESYVRGLRNFEMKPPYKQTSYYLSSIMAEQSWTKTELLEVIDRVTPQALRELISELLTRLHVEGLIHGNMLRTDALVLLQGLEEKLSKRGPILPLHPLQLLKGRELELQDGTHFLYEARNKFHKSSCAETYFQCGLQNTESNMKLELLGQIASEPCFNILRTKEQLGYMVWSDTRRSCGVQGLRFVIQSDKHPDYLMSRIEAFLVYFRELLTEMAPEEFDRHREALAALRLEKPKKLQAQTSIYWLEIACQQYHFDRAEVEVAFLRTITKDQLLEFFDTYIDGAATRRHRLSVYIISDAKGGAGSLEEDNCINKTPDDCPKPPPMVKPQKIDNVTSFKRNHGLYPLVQPYMDLPGQTKSKL